MVLVEEEREKSKRAVEQAVEQERSQCKVGSLLICDLFSYVSIATKSIVRIRRGGTSPLHRSTHFTQHNMFTNTTNDHNWYNNST